MANLIRVLVVDDHAIVRKGVRALLATESDIEMIGEAENGREAVSLTETLQPGWVRTYPISGKHDIYLPPGGTSTNNNFGNVEAPPSIGGDAETLDNVNDGDSYSSILVIAALAAASLLLLKAKN